MSLHSQGSLGGADITCGQASGQKNSHGELCRLPVVHGGDKCSRHDGQGSLIDRVSKENLRLVAHLLARGHTQKYAAEAIGIHWTHMSRLVNHHQFPRITYREPRQRIRRRLEMGPIAQIKTAEGCWNMLYGPVEDGGEQ